LNICWNLLYFTFFSVETIFFFSTSRKYIWKISLCKHWLEHKGHGYIWFRGKCIDWLFMVLRQAQEFFTYSGEFFEMTNLNEWWSVLGKVSFVYFVVYSSCPLKYFPILWRHYHCLCWTAWIRVMFSIYNFCVGRDLHYATLVVTCRLCYVLFKLPLYYVSFRSRRTEHVWMGRQQCT
jgi:hypothetical protein